MSAQKKEKTMGLEMTPKHLSKLDREKGVAYLFAQVNNAWVDEARRVHHRVVYQMPSEVYLAMRQLPLKDRGYFNFDRAQTTDTGIAKKPYSSIEGPGLDHMGGSIRRCLKQAMCRLGFRCGKKLRVLDGDELNLLLDNFRDERVKNPALFPEEEYFVDREPGTKNEAGEVMRDETFPRSTPPRLPAPAQEEQFIRAFASEDEALAHAGTLELAGLNVRVDEEVVTTYRVMVKQA